MKLKDVINESFNFNDKNNLLVEEFYEGRYFLLYYIDTLLFNINSFTIRA